MSQQAAGENAKEVFNAFYDDALPHVYGYLLARCPGRATAEEITAEVFLAAVDVVRKEPSSPMTVPWALGIARHKLIDHWRRRSREERRLRAFALEPGSQEAEDPWDVRLEALRAHQVLDGMAANHRAALTLRYVDDLPVPQVAAEMGRTVHATEALLVRAKAAFRRAYEEDCDG